MRELSKARLHILKALGDGERTSGDLAIITGRHQTNVSRDLRIMAKAGLVTSRRDGPSVYYSRVWTP